MKEDELRSHRCCFTGHRPEKLHVDEKTVCAALEQAVDEAIASGFTTFISGMARGVDIWAAEIVLRKRAENHSLRLICACPYPDFEARWPAEWVRRCHVILNAADLVRSICPAYSSTAYQRRNAWMVNHSARVIAVYNGELGGTRNTVEYAEKQLQPLEIIKINPKSKSQC